MMTAELHHGDALELVPDLGEFDAVITDPPYGTGGKGALKDPASIKEAREMVDGLCHGFLAGVLRGVRKRGGDRLAAFVMTDWRNVSFYGAAMRGCGMEPHSAVVWRKNGKGFSAHFDPTYEMIVYGSTRAFRPAPHATNLGLDYVEVPRVRSADKVHPFDKPPALAEYLLKGFTPGRVLDPFCGAGSLLVGAARLGWDVVGVDISREFVEIARTRLGDGSHEPARARVEGQGGLAL